MRLRNIFLTASASFMALVSGSCVSLDIEPTKNLREDQVYGNEVGITAALATLYAYLPIAAHNASVVGGINGDNGMPFSIWNNPSVVTGEAEVIPLRVAMAPKSCNGDMLAWLSLIHI